MGMEQASAVQQQHHISDKQTQVLPMWYVPTVRFPIYVSLTDPVHVTQLLHGIPVPLQPGSDVTELGTTQHGLGSHMVHTSK